MSLSYIKLTRIQIDLKFKMIKIQIYSKLKSIMNIVDLNSILSKLISIQI